MGRRKQSPSQNLGAVETRSTYRAALTQSYTQPASDEGDSKSSDDDIEEEQQAPERKRRCERSHDREGACAQCVLSDVLQLLQALWHDLRRVS